MYIVYIILARKSFVAWLASGKPLSEAEGGQATKNAVEIYCNVEREKAERESRLKEGGSQDGEFGTCCLHHP